MKNRRVLVINPKRTIKKTIDGKEKILILYSRYKKDLMEKIRKNDDELLVNWYMAGAKVMLDILRRDSREISPPDEHKRPNKAGE